MSGQEKARQRLFSVCHRGQRRRSSAGRIIAVADTFDAMTSDCPNHADRRGKPDDVALAELQRCAGAHFDPRMVKAFLMAYQKEKIISQSRESASEATGS